MTEPAEGSGFEGVLGASPSLKQENDTRLLNYLMGNDG